MVSKISQNTCRKNCDRAPGTDTLSTGNRAGCWFLSQKSLAGDYGLFDKAARPITAILAVGRSMPIRHVGYQQIHNGEHSKSPRLWAEANPRLFAPHFSGGCKLCNLPQPWICLGITRCWNYCCLHRHWRSRKWNLWLCCFAVAVCLTLFPLVCILPSTLLLLLTLV